MLNPGSAQSIELSSALAGVAASTVNDVGVDIDYESAPGAVIGQLTSLNKNGDFAFEVPIKDPKAMNVQMEGVNPWSLENGDNTTLHIKNTTDKVAQALAGLNFPGGTYSLGEIELQPYQTIAINVGKIKTSKTPDPVGHVIPADAVLGQFVWWQETPYTMLGRSEHENVKAGIASSFSCFGSGCCTNYADYYSGGANPLQGLEGTTDFFTVTKEWYDCGGNYYMYTTFPNVSYYSDDTNIATVSEVMVGSPNGTAEDQVHFNNGGTTNIHAYYATKYYTGNDSNNPCQGPFLDPAVDFGNSATTCVPQSLRILYEDALTYSGTHLVKCGGVDAGPPNAWGHSLCVHYQMVDSCGNDIQTSNWLANEALTVVAQSTQPGNQSFTPAMNIQMPTGLLNDWLVYAVDQAPGVPASWFADLFQLITVTDTNNGKVYNVRKNCVYYQSSGINFNDITVGGSCP